MLAEEPLYQFYAAAATRVAFESDSDGYEEVRPPIVFARSVVAAPIIDRLSRYASACVYVDVSRDADAAQRMPLSIIQIMICVCVCVCVLCGAEQREPRDSIASIAKGSRLRGSLIRLFGN